MAVCSQIHTKHINTLCGQDVVFVSVKLAVHVWANGLQRVKDLLVPTVLADNCDVSRFKRFGKPRRASRGLRTFCLWVEWMMGHGWWRFLACGPRSPWSEGLWIESGGHLTFRHRASSV